MLTAEKLKSYTAKDLGQMAKSQGVPGWHGMRKDQLVRALLKTTKSKAKSPARSSRKSSTAGGNSSSRRSKSTNKPNGAVKPASRRSSSPNGARKSKATAVNGSKAKAPKPLTPKQRAARTRVVNRIKKEVDQHRRAKDLSHNNGSGSHHRDRLAVMVRDPFWLHAYWELTRAGVQRAEAALGREWHDSHPVLRLYEVIEGGATSTAERVVEDIEIHGGVNNWYVPVKDPPKSYRLEVGYLSSEGRFFALARSNVVTTPRAGATDTIDQNWSDVAENCEKIFAMSGGYSSEGGSAELQELFEERLRRPMGASPMVPRFANNGQSNEFAFDLDAELIVYGKTETTANVTLQGEPVRLRPDGTFTMRFRLPNCRQVIPAVASSADGVEQRTIVLAVERNTKFLEPIIRDNNDF